MQIFTTASMLQRISWRVFGPDLCETSAIYSKYWEQAVAKWHHFHWVIVMGCYTTKKFWKHSGGFWQLYFHCNNFTHHFSKCLFPFFMAFTMLKKKKTSPLIYPHILCDFFFFWVRLVTCKCIKKVLSLQYYKVCLSWVAQNTTSYDLKNFYVRYMGGFPFGVSSICNFKVNRNG